MDGTYIFRPNSPRRPKSWSCDPAQISRPNSGCSPECATPRTSQIASCGRLIRNEIGNVSAARDGSSAAPLRCITSSFLSPLGSAGQFVELIVGRAIAIATDEVDDARAANSGAGSRVGSGILNRGPRHKPIHFFVAKSSSTER